MAGEKEFLQKVKDMIDGLDPQSNDFHKGVKELILFIQQSHQTLQNLLSDILTGQHKEHLHDLATGFGKEDFLGSTKLGSGTGIILHCALGQGTETGGLNLDRESQLNVKIEQTALEVLDEIRREQDPNMNPFMTNLNMKS